ncbi:MAG: enoyl-CoA hydratase/isomerase family protein [Deltaproteobacteria bacterium]|nr:enoyl-CoA hydratase/isomerase family protein [Candidatus Zymogenaceae bacterium]
MEYHDITVSADGAVAVVVLSRPGALNALSVRLRDELESVLTVAESDPSVDVIVISGGERFFCAGWDLKEAAQTKFASFTHRIVEFHETIYSCRKLIITAVSGIALAGGFDLALAGDIVLAAPGASFGHVEVNFGINPLVFPLARRVGTARAVELCATGRIISAEEAHRIGVVSEIMEEPDFMAAVLDRARAVAGMGGTVLAAVKESAAACHPVSVSDALADEFAVTEQLIKDPALLTRLTDYLTGIGITI